MPGAPAAVSTPPSALSDEAIVSRILGGQTPLFEVLMRRHNQRLHRIARAILHDEQEAEDTMQEAYVSAFSHLAQFGGRAKFSTWLTKIAMHEAFARARRRGRYEPMDDSALETLMPTTSSPDPERLAFGRELGALIEVAVDKLGDGYRRGVHAPAGRRPEHRGDGRRAGRQRGRREDPIVAGPKRAPTRSLRSNRRRCRDRVHIWPGPVRSRRGVRARANRDQRAEFCAGFTKELNRPLRERRSCQGRTSARLDANPRGEAANPPSSSRRRPRRAAVPDLLQDRRDGAGGLGDVREQFGERLAQRQGLAALVLGREHVGEERAAMENALLLACQGVDLLERQGRRGPTRRSAAEPTRLVAACAGSVSRPSASPSAGTGTSGLPGRGRSASPPGRGPRRRGRHGRLAGPRPGLVPDDLVCVTGRLREPRAAVSRSSGVLPRLAVSARQVRAWSSAASS